MPDPKPAPSKGHFLDRIPTGTLVMLAILMALSPFKPMPHLLEKLQMLAAGTLSRPLDIFDLFFHASPTILLGWKLLHQLKSSKQD